MAMRRGSLARKPRRSAERLPKSGTNRRPPAATSSASDHLAGLERELRRTSRTLQDVQTRLKRVELSLDVVQAGPVDRFVSQVVHDLEEGPWGEVLSELHSVSGRQNHDGLQALDLFEQIQALAPALFAALGIRPYPVARQRVRLSTKRAQTYRWADDRPIPPVDRCWFEVLSPGWKRGETVLVPPKIRLAEGPPLRKPVTASASAKRTDGEARADTQRVTEASEGPA